MAPTLTPEKHRPLSDTGPQGSDAEMLERLQRETFDYFLHEVNGRTGLVADKNTPGCPASVAVVGMALSGYIVGVERHFLTRAEAVQRTHRILSFLHSSKQGPEPDASGYKGFYYHFLDMDNGQRAWKSELSTIDTTFLIAGVLSSARHRKPQVKTLPPLRLRCQLQPDFPDTSRNQHGWVSPWRFGLNQGPIVLMLENHATQLLWRLMRPCSYLQDGLRRAGFQGGWLEQA